ncbi:MAG: hypothetical protein KGI50_04960 [Patescibacteria group bacterium]|nr:hypothetical protein [Patescibacteria group bacterium]MDE2438610.1 hypothetical protein [Patescibacteria group bacterium]
MAKKLISSHRSTRLRKLAQAIPSPLATYRKGDVLFYVYRAKNLFSPTWDHPVLKKLVAEARRESYYRYGDIAEFDAYDSKAVVYVARVVYNDVRGTIAYPVEEWATMRFVPRDGVPHDIEDFKEYELHGQPMGSSAHNSLFSAHQLTADNVISGSRLSGIRSYCLRKYDEHDSKHIPRFCYFRECFVLMHHAFLKLNVARNTFRYRVAQTSHEFIERVLTFTVRGQRIALTCTPAHRMLHVAPHAIRLQRKGIVFQYPAYFLNQKELYLLFSSLVKKNLLTSNTLRHYFSASCTQNSFLTQHQFTFFQARLLGTLCSAEGTLYGTLLTGEELRVLVRDISDGPFLSITPLDTVEKNIELFMREEHITRI